MAAALLRTELTCPICTDIYTDPVTLPCGHSYCRLCITKTWENQEERESSCPECRRRFRVRPELKRNQKLCTISESFQSAHHETLITCTYCITSFEPAIKTCLLCEASLCDTHLRVHSTSSEHILKEPTSCFKNKKCTIHEEILMYYCCEDASCICVSCSLAGEHRGHQVETLNEASEKKKEKLRNILQKLNSQREEAEKRVKSLEEIRRQMQKKSSSLVKQISCLIRDTVEELEALEKRVLSEISRQEEQVSLRVSDLIQQLEKEKEELSRKMGDIEELCDMTDPVTVLQERESGRDDYCDTEEEDDEDLDRDHIEIHAESDVDMGLILRKVQAQISDVMSGVRNIYEDVALVAEITLDISTSAENIVITDDFKTAYCSEIQPLYQQNKFHDSQVLSTTSFSSGRHFWEVKVSESGGWCVGMAYPSINRSKSSTFIGYNTFWCLWKLNDMYLVNHINNKIHHPALGLSPLICYSLKDTSKIIQLHHQPLCQRIRIYLDYEAGQLSFYEVCDVVRHIYTLSNTFNEPLHAALRVWDNGWVKILT